MEYVIIILILVLVLFVVLKTNKKDFLLEANKLVEYLGGKNNIILTEVSVSRLKVTLKDVTKVNKDAIQKLGAQGVVEIENQVKIIFAKEAKELKKCIEQLQQYNL